LTSDDGLLEKNYKKLAGRVKPYSPSAVKYAAPLQFHPDNACVPGFYFIQNINSIVQEKVRNLATHWMSFGHFPHLIGGLKLPLPQPPTAMQSGGVKE